MKSPHVVQHKHSHTRNHHALALNFPAPTARQDFFLLPFLRTVFLGPLLSYRIHPLPLFFASFPLNVHMPFPLYHGESSSVQLLLLNVPMANKQQALPDKRPAALYL